MASICMKSVEGVKYARTLKRRFANVKSQACLAEHGRHANVLNPAQFTPCLLGSKRRPAAILELPQGGFQSNRKRQRGAINTFLCQIWARGNHTMAFCNSKSLKPMVFGKGWWGPNTIHVTAAGTMFASSLELMFGWGGMEGGSSPTSPGGPDSP